CNGGIYVESSEATTSRVHRAIPDQIRRPAAGTGGADRGVADLDRSGLYSRGYRAAVALEHAVLRAPGPLGLSICGGVVANEEPNIAGIKSDRRFGYAHWVSHRHCSRRC